MSSFQANNPSNSSTAAHNTNNTSSSYPVSPVPIHSLITGHVSSHSTMNASNSTLSIKERVLQSLNNSACGSSPYSLLDVNNGKLLKFENPKEERFMHNSIEQENHQSLSGSSSMTNNHSSTFIDYQQQQRRYSSTSSVYAEHTLSDPNNDQVLYCIGAVLQAQMFDDFYNSEFSSAAFPEFDLQLPKLPSEYGGERDVIPAEILDHETLHDNELRELLLQRALPTVDTIYRFMKYLMVLTEYSIECNIIALVYINRISVRHRIPVTKDNWRGLWLGAIILAQKVWDDKPLKTTSFCTVFTDLVKEQVINVEMKVFSLLEYSTTVRPSVYAKYFFELHELFKEITGNTQGYSWNMQPLSIAEKRKLELRSKKHGREYRREMAEKAAKQAAKATAAPVAPTAPIPVNISAPTNPATIIDSPDNDELAQPIMPKLNAEAPIQPTTTSQSQTNPLESKSNSVTNTTNSSYTTNTTTSTQSRKKIPDDPFAHGSRTLEDVTYCSLSRYVIN